MGLLQREQTSKDEILKQFVVSHVPLENLLEALVPNRDVCHLYWPSSPAL